MPIKIDPIHKIGLSCVELCCVNTAKYFREEYQLLFHPFFNFQFLDNMAAELTFSQRLIHEEFVINALQTYYNIKVFSEWNIRDGLQILQRNLHKEYPVVINIDPLYCKWLSSPAHIKGFHRFVLVIGYHDGQFTCLDQGNIIHEIAMADLIKGVHYICYFKPQNSIKINHISMIKDHVSSLDLKTNFKNFRECLGECETIEKESDRQNINVKLLKIGHKRSLYAEFLLYIPADKAQRRILETLAAKFLKLKEQWIDLGNLIEKSIITSSYYQQKDKLIGLTETIQKEELKIQNILSNL